MSYLCDRDALDPPRPTAAPTLPTSPWVSRSANRAQAAPTSDPFGGRKTDKPGVRLAQADPMFLLAAREDDQQGARQDEWAEADLVAKGKPARRQQSEPGDRSQDEAEGCPLDQRLPAQPAEHQADEPAQLDVAAAKLSCAGQPEPQVRGGQNQLPKQLAGH